MQQSMEIRVVVYSSRKTTTVLVQDSTASMEDGALLQIIINNFAPYRCFCRYAMERTTSSIKVWFWERDDRSAPFDATSGASSIDTNFWVMVLIYVRLNAYIRSDCQGTPAAYFPNTYCDLASHFDANNIIINLTFCESCLVCSVMLC
jgi:hypothetical protein